MSSYYYIWQAALKAQEAGLWTIVKGSLALSAAWIVLPWCIPAKYLQLARRILSWTILAILAGTITLLAVSR